jgi:putative transposase
LFKLKKRKPVPKKISNPIREAIGSVLAVRRIERLAWDLGVIKRQRKLSIAAFVGAVVLGFATGAQRSLAGMRRAYERCTGQSLAPSAFYARFTREMAQLLRRLVEETMADLQKRAPKLKHALARFDQVLAADGSLIKLHKSLASQFPSVFPNKVGAAAKLHVVINVAGRSARSVQLVAGKRHDVTILKLGPWVAGKLLILDLAYRKGLLYKQIADNKGYFLLRKKQSDDPLITDPRWRGKRLSALVEAFVGKTFDVDAAVPWQFDRGPNKNRRHTLPVRVVGQWNADEGHHHFYLTNAPRDMMAAEHVGPIYAARWEVELFFRELKLTHRLEQLPTRKRFVSESLIYAALLSLLLSRRLRERLLPAAAAFPVERWARLFATFALDILNVTFGSLRACSADAKRLANVLRREAPDPNQTRLNLLARAQSGLLRAALTDHR